MKTNTNRHAMRPGPDAQTTCKLHGGTPGASVEVIRLCNYVRMTLSINQDPGYLPRITPGLGVRSQTDLSSRTEHRTPPSTLLYPVLSS